MRSIFQNKPLAYTIIFLLIVNLGMLAYFAFFKENQNSRMKGKRPINEFVEKDLGFTEQQQKTFEDMRAQNKTRMMQLFEENSKAKDSLYQLVLVENLDDSILFDRSLAIAEKQRAIELEFFRQYKSILAMCTPEQKIKFDSGFMPMVRKMYRRKLTDSTKK